MSISAALMQAIVSGPSLIDDLPEAKAFRANTLQAPETITELNFSQKLGHLYEDALAALLNATAHLDLLARNLQVQQDRHRTVGELDFLFRDLVSGQLIHLELATKFYLAVPHEGTFRLPGPDARDDYDRKLARLRSHQLQLTRRYRDSLPEDYRRESIEPQHLVQGCLFDHLTTDDLARPDFSNPACQRGKWLRINELKEHFGAKARFQVIPKPLWPVPFEQLEAMTLDPWERPADLDRCVMVRCEELNKPLFVTPQTYPLTSSS